MANQQENIDMTIGMRFKVSRKIMIPSSECNEWLDITSKTEEYMYVRFCWLEDCFAYLVKVNTMPKYIPKTMPYLSGSTYFDMWISNYSDLFFETESEESDEDENDDKESDKDGDKTNPRFLRTKEEILEKVAPKHRKSFAKNF